MRVVELFAGVGGFRLGLERAGHTVVYANEWDRFACDTYDKNFGGSVDRRDITTIPASDIPAHDIICGGFPCQAFSVAGKRRGFEETRGTLFFDIMRIAQAHRTPYLFLENVKGLLSHDRGRTFATIITTMDELGYDCQWQVLNSKNFGVPQNRERIIIVGHLRGRPRPQIFPIEQDDCLATSAFGETRPEAQISPTIRAHGSGGHGDLGDSYIIANTLTSSGGGPAIDDTFAIAFRGRNGKLTPEVRDDGLANALRTAGSGSSKPMILDGKPSSTRRTPPSEQARTLDQDANQVLAVTGQRLRRLTPIECERLQGFPDNWTAGVSDTQRYKQMGNAVTVNVIEAVARRLPV